MSFHTWFSVAYAPGPVGGSSCYTMIAERALGPSSHEADAVLKWCRSNFGCTSDPESGWSYSWWPTRLQPERTLIVDIYDADHAALFILRYGRG